MGWDYANDGKNLQSYHVLDSFRVVEKKGVEQHVRVKGNEYKTHQTNKKRLTALQNIDFSDMLID